MHTADFVRLEIDPPFGRLVLDRPGRDFGEQLESLVHPPADCAHGPPLLLEVPPEVPLELPAPEPLPEPPLLPELPLPEPLLLVAP